MQNQKRKKMKRTKNENRYSSDETVRVIVDGVSPEGGRESIYGGKDLWNGWF